MKVNTHLKLSFYYIDSFLLLNKKALDGLLNKALIELTCKEY